LIGIDSVITCCRRRVSIATILFTLAEYKRTYQILSGVGDCASFYAALAANFAQVEFLLISAPCDAYNFLLQQLRQQCQLLSPRGLHFFIFESPHLGKENKNFRSWCNNFFF